jgi:hypothetical protein
MAIVYRHIRQDTNETFYVGIGITVHRAYAKSGRNMEWKHIVNNTNYTIDILFDDLSIDDAELKERELIELYGRIDLNTGTLVNKTSGGQRCNQKIFTKTHKQNISKSRIGLKFNDEHKSNLSKSHLGQVAWNAGKALSNEHTTNITKSIKTYYDGLSKEEKLVKCSTYGMLNKTHKESSKEKTRQSLLGRIREKVKCPHCNKMGGPGGFNRYHFNNCKNKK